ncbi:MAG: EAL domain-containing protein [Pseudanabaena sp. ELA645]|jgi:diguanylate cyclase (GGDEF)-like protein
MNKPSILVVDDEPNNFDVIEIFLCSDEESDQQTQDYQLHYAASGKTAIASLETCQPDLILLDVMMPEMDGIEVCKRIKMMPKWSAVPIIMVTALTSKQDLAKCLEAGADDFISKPVSRLEMIARVRSMLRIYDQYKQLANFNAKLESMVQQRTSQLQSMLLEDTLTKLPSRVLLLQVLTERLQAENSSLALIYLDCDQFKLVNGSFGHAVGNQLLVAIANRLQRHLRFGDLLARMGEDEFCFLIDNVEDESDVIAFREKIINSFSTPFLVSNCEIYISVCMGIALSKNSNSQPEELLQDADTAMYQAKLRGKDSHQVFDRQMHMLMLNRLTLENDLKRGLEQQEFILYYQPIIDLATEKLAGFEALVRWQHPDRGMVSPAEFIPSMETTGLIVPVGMVVFQQACEQLRIWQQQGWTDITVSVNLSVRQFSCPTLLADIDRILAETQVDPTMLKLEITESAIMDNAESAIAITEELRSRHMQISIDDFGTGYSSLGYLHRFPVDNLKIDRSFVNQIQPESRNYHVVDTIISLSNQLGLDVIAEGIETAEQLKWLQQIGCKYGQGYLFNKPLPIAEVERIYIKN